MAFPSIPDGLRSAVPAWFWNWWQDFRSYLLVNLSTNGDITMLVKKKGIIMTNAAGTVTKRARLNDAGNGWVFEDV